MKSFFTLLFIIICCMHFNAAANILAIFTMESPSHHIWNSRLVVALAKKGHNVTVVSPEAQKIPVPNLTDLVTTGSHDEASEEFDQDEMTKIPQWIMTGIFLDFMSEECIKTLKSDAWTQLMAYPDEMKFELIIIESIGTECLLGGLARFGNPPIISINAFNVPQWAFERTATPNAFSHIPHFMYSTPDKMTFMERATNLFYNIYMHYLYHHQYLPAMDNAAQEYYGTEIQTFSEIQKRICMEMANYHPALDYPYAKTPNLIPLAGIQVTDPKPLPEDIKKFLDEAKEGAIFFSLGSNVKSENVPPEKRKAILEAFSALPQKVLWKFEADTLPGQPKNVKIGKWLPQSDILAHPNVKVFVTHSGLLSTHEAIYRGVPVVGIPFFADQPINIQKMVNHGAGIRLDYGHLTKESLLEALNKVLHDSSYRENMKALSAKIRDDPETPLERAVFWTEYVLRHKGATHLQSAARDMSFVQYFLLDVIALLLSLPLLFFSVVYYLCCKKSYKGKGKEKTN